MAPWTPTIIKSPPLPGWGKLPRARAMNQSCCPQTSWTLSEEVEEEEESRAFFFSKNRPFLWFAAERSYARRRCNLQLHDGSARRSSHVQTFSCGFVFYYAKGTSPACPRLMVPLNNAVIIKHLSLLSYSSTYI